MPSLSVAWKSLDKEQDFKDGLQSPSLQAAQALLREWQIPFVRSWKTSSVCVLKAIGMGFSLATVMAIPEMAFIVLF